MSDPVVYLFLGCFLLGALAVPLFPVLLARFVAPKKPGPIKQESYECGVEAKGDVWVQFRIQYYVFAILFVVFDVEALFLFPWAVIFKEAGVPGLIAMGIFLGILALGLLYAWIEGALEWDP
ncbi:MAG: NADH-quinone oxidoreductase subunit A [Candidatus Omnitrophica bacterium]|nr:NADH-quinone oxidoreductase subunit A [Candidatus Omnitrophota bacterium]